MQWWKRSIQSNLLQMPACHLVAEVGEDAGAHAGLLELVRPGEHGRVDVGPEVVIGGDERGDLGGFEAETGVGGDGEPVLLPGVGAAVVGVARSPVGSVEGGLVEAGEGEHARPDGGRGRAGEDHAEVEEDSLYLSHGLKLF